VATRVAFQGAKVVAMQINHGLQHDAANPHIKRAFRRLDKVFNSLDRAQVRILQYIVNANTTIKSTIKSEIDQSQKPRLVFNKNVRQYCLRVIAES